MKIKSNRGFTLIELIITITIIGILAAIAIPRYISMQSNARSAKLQAAMGSTASASKLFKAQCMVDGGACATVNMDGAAVTGVNQYPSATVAGIATAAGIAAMDYSITAAAGVVTVGVTSPTANSCEFTYSEAAAGGSPSIAMTSSACN